ncbi:hypothetical protein MMC21_006621 [Puttea exsequens]|nr:hypothetical protein [Puttea exsequens]
MRAWQYPRTSPGGGLESHLTLNHAAPLPPNAQHLGPTDILVKVAAAALNPADYKVPELPIIGRLVVGVPASPGMDFVGEVVAAGSRLKKDGGQGKGDEQEEEMLEGQMVFGRLDGPSKFGTLGEYIVVSRKGCVRVPDGVMANDAACIATAALTAYQSLAPYVRPGARVFVNGGSGGTGVFAVQIAKVLGCTVVVTCSGANEELCRALGADETVDYTKGGVVRVLEGMRRFDHVVDNVGAPKELYWECHRFMTEKAQFVQVGGEVSWGALGEMVQRFLWPGFLGGGKRPFRFLGLKTEAGELKILVEWVKEGKLKVVIDEVFEWDNDGPIKAFQKLKTGRARGKIVVEGPK